MDRETQSIALEKRHVHNVYNKIAPHFSDTRYKAWPRVKEFLLDLEPGSLVADVGCGNGKYLGINNQIYKVGCDCCVQLVDIARDRKHEVMVCDNIRLPYRNDSFDAVISIAVIHHFATTERRAHALRELARICRPGGQVMIYVWAMEQKQRKFDSQDVLVPWRHLQLANSKGRRNKCEPDLPSSSGSTTSDEDMKRTPTPPLPSSSTSHHNPSSAPPSSYSLQKTGRASSGTAFPFPQCSTSTGSQREYSNIRIQSDSCAQEITSVENSHFKRLLIPTRSDSADDVFVDTSSYDLMDNDGMARDSYARILPLRGETKVRTRSSSPLTSPKLPVENGNDKPQSPLSTATKFLFDSKVFQETKENITSAIESRMSSSSEEKSSSLWDLIFGGQKGKQEEMEEELVQQTTALCNGNNSMQDISNGANGILPVSKTLKNKRSTFSRTQSLDRDATLCVLQKTNGQLAYAARQSSLISSNQPIVGLNPMTAQGQLYRKPARPMRKSPLASHEEGAPSPIESLSSSNESLSAIPVDSTPESKEDNVQKPPSIENDPFAKCKPKKRTKSLDVNNQATNDECVSDNSSTAVVTNGINGDVADIESAKLALPELAANIEKHTNDIHPVKTMKPPPQVNGGVANSKSGKASSDSQHDDLSKALRYYHVFRERELVDLIEKHVDNLHIIRTYYDHANWCVIAEKVEVWRI